MTTEAQTTPTLERVRALLLDIEGTTTPIDFVHQTLFPYARARLEDYLGAHLEEPEVAADVGRLREEHAADVRRGKQPPPLSDDSRETVVASLAAYARWLIDQDRKAGGLKSLQGKIWRRGYEEGELRAPLYADVAPALRRWREAGLKVAIFSSGSVLAQQLLFRHTEEGDLTPLVDAYFDTANAGPKHEAESFRRIAAALRLDAPEILFVSDAVMELDAAAEAGMRTRLSLRPGNAPRPYAERYASVRGFDQLP